MAGMFDFLNKNFEYGHGRTIYWGFFPENFISIKPTNSFIFLKLTDYKSAAVVRLLNI